MQKIMFNDRYGLTKAVLEGRKTMTRRVVNPRILPQITEMRVLPNGLCQYKDPYIGKWYDCSKRSQPKYQVGEVVAVAQSYKDAGILYDERTDEILEGCAGWTNKMFVTGYNMPNRIRITNVRVERLQDISDEDVFREGFEKQSVNNGWGNAAWHWEAIVTYMDYRGRYKDIRSPYPREAFSCLIDKISGIGTWDCNPWVFVYEFELVK